MRAPLLISTLLVSLSSSAFAAESYAEATARGKQDATNPAHRQWYLTEMRPAFSRFFGPTLNECAPLASQDEMHAFGLVFTVTPEGAVGRTFWKTPGRFTSCIEKNLRANTFPGSPVFEFYFGLEASFGG